MWLIVDREKCYELMYQHCTTGERKIETRSINNAGGFQTPEVDMSSATRRLAQRSIEVTSGSDARARV